MSIRTEVKRILATSDTTEGETTTHKHFYERISLWQKDAVKMHSHVLYNKDPICNVNIDVAKTTYGCAFYPMDEDIVGIGYEKTFAHSPLHDTSVFQGNNQKVFNGTHPHICGNGDDVTLACMYGCNHLLYGYKNTYNVTKHSYISPISSEYNFVDVQYVNGLWVLISTTNIYYSTNPLKGFNSMKYCGDKNTYSYLRYNQSAVCEYGDYYYIVAIDYYGTYLCIEINKENLNITDVKTGLNLDYRGAYCIIPTKSKDEIGLTPLILTSRVNHYVTCWWGNSPKELNEYTGFETSIYCSSSNVKVNRPIVGFECADNIISVIYNNTGSQNVSYGIINLSEKQSIHIGDTKTNYSGSEFYWFNTSDYFGVYALCQGNYGASVFSSRNGIEWNNNWGYIYTENVDKTHNVVTSVIKEINEEHKEVEGMSVGNGESIIYTNLNFKPKKMICTSTKITLDETLYEQHKLVFEDKHGETWSISYYNNTDNINTTSINYSNSQTYVYYYTLDFNTNIICASKYCSYRFHSDEDSYASNLVPIGSFTWNGGSITIELNDPKNTFGLLEEGRVFNWRAIK